MRSIRCLLIGLFAAAMIVYLAGAVARAVEMRPILLDATELQLTFGLKDNEPTQWDGRMTLSKGKILQLVPAQRRQRVTGDSWKLATRPAQQKKKKQRRRAQLVRPTLRAVIQAPVDATVTISTAQGEFSFALASVPVGQTASFLKGQVGVTRTTHAAPLTDQPTEDDWPAVAVGPDGRVWAVYTAYRNGPPIDAAEIHAKQDFDVLRPTGNGDQLRLVMIDGQQTSRPMNVTGSGLDLWRPAIAVDASGRVWIVWSQNFDGNWDLVVRTYEPQTDKWSEPRVLARPQGADTHPALAADRSSGKVFVAWQGWQEDNFEIWLARLDQPSDKFIQLTQTAANEWNPAAAFDSRGRLHVVFDTYEKGNYDVKLVSDAAGPGRRTIAVADSPLFEARASLAIDQKDRVWVAYEQGGPYWGKDFGTRWGKNFGEQFYLQRDIIVRCVADGRVQQATGIVPADPVNNRYTPSGEPNRMRKISLPRLAFDPDGRLWLLHRRHADVSGGGERWVSFATWHTGDGWSKPIRLSRSANQLDNRPGVVPLRGQGLLVVHSCDGRTTGTGSRQQNDLYATLLKATGPAQLPELVEPPPAETPVASGHETEAEDIQRMRQYRATIGGKQYRLLRGEFHRHTELTSHRDQDGLLEEIWRYGLDVARMDWLGDGDHDNGGGKEYLWWLVQKQTDIYHHPPTFTPMFTYERSVRYPSGHRNVMFSYRGVRPLPRYPGGDSMLYGSPEKGSPDIRSLYAYLKHFDGICAIHTSATNMGTDWRDNDPEVEPVVEIYQGHRQNYEHDGAPGSAQNAKDSIGGYQPLGFVWNALMRGYRLGFEVSSDHISTHVSYAVVFAEDASREAILDAFKRRHCYGANDNILLDVRCGEHMMGDEFELQGKPTLTIYAVGTEPIASVSIIRGVEHETPTYVYRSRPMQREVRMRWTDTAPPAGKMAYYYVRIEQVKPAGAINGALAWASPMWIHLK